MPPLHLALVLSIMAAWGFTFVAIDVGLKEISPLLLVALRFFFTCFPVIFFVKKPAVAFRWVILYSLVMFVLEFSLLFFGMAAGVSPGLASLLLQLQAFFTLFFAVMFFKEPLNRWSVIGALVAFSGIALVMANLGADVTLIGLLLVLAAAATWALGSMIVKKIGNVEMFPLVVWGSLVAWPPMLLLSLLTEDIDKAFYGLTHLSWAAISAILYLSYCSTLVGFAAWNWLLHRHPLIIVAPFTLLVPIFGMLSSAVILGEPLQYWKIIAALLVITGLCINLLGPRLFPRSTL